MSILAKAWRSTIDHWILISFNGWPLIVVNIIMGAEFLGLEESGESSSLLLNLSIIASIILYLSFCVFVVRIGLKGAPKRNRYLLKFGRTEIFVFLYGLLFWIVSLLGAVLAAVVWGVFYLIGSSLAAIAMGAFTYAAILLYLVVRLALITPAIVAERPQPWGYSWRLSDRRFWKIGGPILATLAIGLVLASVQAILEIIPLIGIVFLVPATVVGVYYYAFLSFVVVELYQQLTTPSTNTPPSNEVEQGNSQPGEVASPPA